MTSFPKNHKNFIFTFLLRKNLVYKIFSLSLPPKILSPRIFHYTVVTLPDNSANGKPFILHLHPEFLSRLLLIVNLTLYQKL